METFEGYDVFIQAGQSNAEGFGVGDSLYEYVLDEDILYISYDKIFSVAKRGIMNNFSLSFSARYKAEGLLKENRSSCSEGPHEHSINKQNTGKREVLQTNLQHSIFCRFNYVIKQFLFIPAFN